LQDPYDELDMYGKVDGIADMASTSAIVAARSFESRAADFASRPGHQTSRRGVFWRPASVLARVARALRLRRNSLAGKSFFSACSAVWDALCTTFQYQQVPAVTAVRQSRAQKRPCHEAGMCICNARGAMLQRFCRRLDEVAKIFFGKGKPLRPLFGQARVAYLFVAQAREQYDQDPEGEVEAVTFFHVSDHSYTPWESMSQMMGCDVAFATMGGGPPSLLALKLSLVYYRRYFMADLFDLSLRWCVAAYTTEHHATMSPIFRPDRLQLSLLRDESGAALHEVWCPWRKPGKRRQRQQKRAANPGLLAALEADLAEVEQDSDCSGPDPPGVNEGMCDESSHASEADSIDDGGGPPDDPGGTRADSNESESDSRPSSTSSSPSSASSVCSMIEGTVGTNAAASGVAASGVAASGAAQDLPDAVGEAEGLLPVPRSLAPITVQIGAGLDTSTIVSYTSGQIYAYCRGGGHGARCCKSRKGHAGRSPATGRPLGYLMWWLQQGSDHDTAGDHSRAVAPTWAERRAARTLLQQVPGAQVLFQCERKQRDDEGDSEPEGLP